MSRLTSRTADLESAQNILERVHEIFDERKEERAKYTDLLKKLHAEYEKQCGEVYAALERIDNAIVRRLDDELPNWRDIVREATEDEK